MPIPAVRVIVPTAERNFGRFGDAVEVPDLTDVQTRSYDRFLQLDITPEKRTVTGLEGVLKEIFPIESYDKKISLDYVKYELGKPRYDPDECRQLRLTATTARGRNHLAERTSEWRTPRHRQKLRRSEAGGRRFRSMDRSENDRSREARHSSRPGPKSRCR